MSPVPRDPLGGAETVLRLDRHIAMHIGPALLAFRSSGMMRLLSGEAERVDVWLVLDLLGRLAGCLQPPDPLLLHVSARQEDDAHCHGAFYEVRIALSRWTFALWSR
jgi:hypothetical protein